MSIKVLIPTPLRGLTNEQETVEAAGTTVAEIIDDLERNYPGMFERLCDENGEVRFLEDGNRDPVLRCWEVRWTREDLISLHNILTTRQAELKADIENPEYMPGNPPPIRHGYDCECEPCPVKERIGCPGRNVEDLEQELRGSIQALQAKELSTA